MIASQQKVIGSTWRVTKPFLIIGTLLGLILFVLVLLEDEQIEISSFRKAPTTVTGSWLMKKITNSKNDTLVDDNVAPKESESAEKQADMKKNVEASNSTINHLPGADGTTKHVTEEAVDLMVNVRPPSGTKGNSTTLQTPVPPWSKLPPSQFTNHVLDIIMNFNLANVYGCSQVYNLTVSVPDTIPTVACDPALSGNYLFCITLRRIFSSRPLPYNVSVGFQLSDYTPQNILAMNSCLGSSAVDGKFCMPNMEDIGEMNFREPNHDRPELYKWQLNDTKPWKDRISLPVFRGQLWLGSGEELCQHPNFTYELAKDRFPMRLKAVDFSVDHPDLLDARFSLTRHPTSACMQQNATNGFSKLLHWSEILKDEYFADYQVALVLGGYGAAFRTSRHFMTRTAVLLEDFVYKEWFTPYLEPFVHFVPLTRNLDNLHDTLLWVRDHPEDLKRIADNGRAFYDKYLTFYQNEKHIYELVYRLAEYSHSLENVDEHDGPDTVK